MRLLRRLVALVGWHVSRDERPAVGEGEARITLYPTSGRDVAGVPQEPPVSASDVAWRIGADGARVLAEDFERFAHGAGDKSGQEKS